jgi:hypothetical protein
MTKKETAGSQLPPLEVNLLAQPDSITKLLKYLQSLF